MTNELRGRLFVKVIFGMTIMEAMTLPVCLTLMRHNDAIPVEN